MTDFGLYAGCAPGGWVWAPPEAGMLVLGPPRSGKTAAVVVPNVLAAPGAVVATSTKADVAEATLAGRGRRGRCWLFDPTGRAPVPPGMSALRWSPLSGCGDWEVSLARAHALARASRPGRGLVEATHWVERAEALLGPLLHAGARGHLGLEAVLRWVLRREVGQALAALGEGDSLAADTLAGIDLTEERERSGIFSTAASILSPYRSGAALAAASAPNFDPEGFVASADTAYVWAPAQAQDQLAPLVVALVEEVRAAAYARGPGGPGVLFALDEVANIAPLPGLPALVAEGGSQGVVTLACLQDLSQARARWGEAAAGFLSLFGAKLVLAGIGDGATLELLSSLCGEADVVLRSTTRGRWPLVPGGPRPTVSTGTVRRRRLPVDAVARGMPGAALWLVAGAAPAWVRLTPWYACSPWREVARGERVPAASPPSWAAPPRLGAAGSWLAGRWLGGLWRAGWGRPRWRRRWRAVLAVVVVALFVLPPAWWSLGVTVAAVVLAVGWTVRSGTGRGRWPA